MELSQIKGKQNIVNAYDIKPTLPYDIEGTLIEKKGNKVKVESDVGGKTILYTLKLKQEIEEKVGDKVHIEKENIISSKMDIEEEKKEDIKGIRKLEHLLGKLGIEVNKENLEVAKILENNGIPVTKQNIDSFLLSKKYLDKIIENVDYDSVIKLLNDNVSIEEQSIQKLALSLEDAKIKDDSSFLEILGIKKDLTYEDAEKISQKIYGRKMGKDIYDSIIALHRKGIDITKKNIEKVNEVVYKLHDLKGIDNKTFVKLIKQKLKATIDNLYKLKNSYIKEKINTNIASSIYENFTIPEETNRQDIIKLLENMNVENTESNILILKELIINGLEASKENLIKIKDMKNNLEKLESTLNEENTTILLEKGINPLKEDIKKLLLYIKDIEVEKENNDYGNKNSQEILEKIKDLGQIKDRDLVFLLKNGQDFKIDNLKDITLSQNENFNAETTKVVKKTLNISNIFNTLGDLDSNVINFTSRKCSDITLNNLYESKKYIDNNEVSIKPIQNIENDIIRQEYLKAKNNVSLRLVKESISEGLELEYMPLEEVNEFIDKKTNKYKRAEDICKNIKSLKRNSTDLISLVMKNDLEMCLKELHRFDSFNKNQNEFGKLLGDAFELSKNAENNEEIKIALARMKGKVKDVSDSLRDGDESVKEDYKNLIKSFKEMNNSFDFDQRKNKFKDVFKQMKDSLKVQNMMSSNNLVVQFPVLIGEDLKNLKVFVPNLDKGIDKSNMNFLLNLNTNTLGNISLNLEIKQKDIFININGNQNLKYVIENKTILERGFKNIGYNLKGIFVGEDKNLSKQDYSLKSIDTKI